MSEQKVLQSASDVAANPAEVYGRIARLAWEATSPSRFYGEALAVAAEVFSSPYAAIDVGLSSQVIHETYHSGPMGPGFWEPPIQDLITLTLTESESQAKAYHARGGKLQVALLSAVVRAESGAPMGALGMVVHVNDPAEVKQHHLVLESLAGLISSCALFIGRSEPTGGGQTDSGLAQVLGRAADYSSRQEMAFAITNNLRNRTGCAQVALGLVRDGQVNVVSISGLDDVRKRTPGVGRIRAAMAECLDHQAPIAYPPAREAAEEGITGYMLHKQWHSSAGGAAVASIPLWVDGKCEAVLSVQRDGANPFEPDKLEQLGTSISTYITALTLVERATRGLLSHATHSMQRLGRTVTAPGHWFRKAALAAAVLVASWVAFGTMEYTVTAPCTVMPTEYRHFSAPHTSELLTASIAPGDRVKTGDVLCRFDTRSLELERARLDADIQIAKVEAHEAMGANDSVKVQLAQAKLTRLEALIQIVAEQIDQATVVAKFDGIVLSGDLRKRVGQVISQGEPLYQVSSESGWTLQVRIPESASAGLAADQLGQFASHVRPGDEQSFRVVRVRPTAEVGEGSNVYIAEAELDGRASWIRPGMEGAAKVCVGRRPVWWVASHRVVNYLRFKLWL